MFRIMYHILMPKTVHMERKTANQFGLFGLFSFVKSSFSILCLFGTVVGRFEV